MINKLKALKIISMINERVEKATETEAEATAMVVSGVEQMLLEGYRKADDDMKAETLAAMAAILVAEDYEKENEDEKAE